MIGTKGVCHTSIAQPPHRVQTTILPREGSWGIIIQQDHPVFKREVFIQIPEPPSPVPCTFWRAVVSLNEPGFLRYTI